MGDYKLVGESTADYLGEGDKFLSIGRLYNYFTKGIPEKKGDESITEGIGQARVTKNLENCIVDSSYFLF